METKIIKNKISIEELKDLAHEQYIDIIKAVVDDAQGIMGVGGELHVDIQSVLVEQENSRGTDIWGINLYLEKSGDYFVEFDSMINLKPNVGNRTRNVEDEAIRKKIWEVVKRLVK